MAASFEVPVDAATAPKAPPDQRSSTAAVREPVPALPATQTTPASSTSRARPMPPPPPTPNVFSQSYWATPPPGTYSQSTSWFDAPCPVIQTVPSGPTATALATPGSSALRTRPAGPEAGTCHSVGRSSALPAIQTFPAASAETDVPTVPVDASTNRSVNRRAAGSSAPAIRTGLEPPASTWTPTAHSLVGDGENASPSTDAAEPAWQ